MNRPPVLPVVDVFLAILSFEDDSMICVRMATVDGNEGEIGKIAPSVLLFPGSTDPEGAKNFAGFGVVHSSGTVKARDFRCFFACSFVTDLGYHCHSGDDATRLIPPFAASETYG